jgi:N-acetylmuramoyl-L-alanine amidase
MMSTNRATWRKALLSSKEQETFMSSRSAKIIVSVIILASLVVLVLSATGQLWNRDNPQATTESSPGASTVTTAVTTATPAITAATQTTVESTQPLQPLPVNIIDPEPTPAIGLRRWPAESSLPMIRQPDLSVYVGRAQDQQPLTGITVILDPGHGGQDGGAIYPNKSQSPEILEKDIVLAVTFKTRDLLESMGATVILTRQADEWHSIYNRIAQTGQYAVNQMIEALPGQGYQPGAIAFLLPKLAEMISINSDAEDSGGRGILKGIGLNADGRLLLDTQAQFPDTLFISLHCNALSNDTRVRGMQVYYLTSEANYRKEARDCQYTESMLNEPAYMLYDDAGRTRLAILLRDSILKQLPELKFGGKSDLLQENYAVLREMNLVNALVEMAFVTNEADRQLLLDPAGQQKIAAGVAEAVYLYYCG